MRLREYTLSFTLCLALTCGSQLSLNRNHHLCLILRLFIFHQFGLRLTNSFHFLLRQRSSYYCPYYADVKTEVHSLIFYLLESDREGHSEYKISVPNQEFVVWMALSIFSLLTPFSHILMYVLLGQKLWV